MKNVDAVSIVNQAKLNQYHIMLVFWCSLLMLFDGYDMVIYGSLLPHLMTEWQISPARAGLLGSASLIGMMLGAATLTMASDKFGRKKIILLCTTIFSFAMIMNFFAYDQNSFFICRLITGFGLGGAIPTMVTIIKEMAPQEYRNRLINFMLAFYGVGAILSGLAGLFLIPAFGWKSVFIIGGLSLLVLPFMYRTFPESIHYLLQKNQQQDIIQSLGRLNPQHIHHNEMHYISDVSNQNQNTSVIALFNQGKSSRTLLIWISFGMTMLMVYGLNTWLPKLMTVGGYSLVSGISFLVVLNVGNIFGTMLFGLFADKWGPRNTLIFGFLALTLSISCLGFHPPSFVLHILLMITGGVMFGCLSVLHTLAADFYPTHIRSTGIGFAAAVGRFGAIAGPLVGGALLAMQLPFEQNFMVFGVAGLVAAVSMTVFKPQKKQDMATENNA